jgi:hypothetical protein
VVARGDVRSQRKTFASCPWHARLFRIHRKEKISPAPPVNRLAARKGGQSHRFYDGGRTACSMPRTMIGLPNRGHRIDLEKLVFLSPSPSVVDGHWQ